MVGKRSSGPRALVLAAALLAWPLAAEAELTPIGPDLRIDDVGGLGNSQASSSRHVAVQADGSGLALFRANGTDFLGSIYVRRLNVDGEPVGQPIRVSPEDAAVLDEQFSVARVDASGFVVVYRRFDDVSGPSLFARLLDSSGFPIGTDFEVSSVPSYFPGYHPSVSGISDSGDFVVVWIGDDGGNPPIGGVFGRRFDGGGAPASDNFRVNTYLPGSMHAPEVASAGDGSFVVAWQSGTYGNNPPGPDGAYHAVAARRFGTDGAAIGDEFVVNTFTPYSEKSPDVAVHTSGSFVVVWHTPYGDDEGGGLQDVSHSVTMRRYDAGGSPIGDEFHLNAFTPGNQDTPAVAMNDDGSFVVVWQSESGYYNFDPRDTDGGGIVGRCFGADGTPQGGDLLINSFTTGRQFRPSVQGTGDNRFIVTWQGRDGDSQQFTEIFGIGSRTVTCGDVPPAPRLAADKDDGAHLWGADDLIVYSIRATNTGDATARDVSLTEVVPVKTDFVPGSSTGGWDCGSGGGPRSVCTLALGDIAAGASVDVEFAVRVRGGTSPLWRIYNSVRADSPSVTVSAAASDATEHSLCDLMSFDPALCSAVCYFVPSVCEASGGGSLVRLARAARALGVAPFSTLRLRDEVLPDLPGGQRAIDLYYDNSAEGVAAAMSDSNVVDTALEAAAALAPLVQPLLDGEGHLVTISFEQVNAAVSFFSALRTAASPELAAVIDRELARVNLDSMGGMKLDEALARVRRISCQGFEEELFCCEVTGDCVVTATDALAILRMSVNLVEDLPEGDADGNGSISATDALSTLLVAVGSRPRPTACNTFF
jgi:uncharacterized repeat protein (TIGR01451 family)